MLAPAAQTATCGSCSQDPLRLRLTAIRDLSEGIRSFTFARPEGTELPSFTEGAHVDIVLPCGPRSYSLTNPPSERACYEIAVNRDAASRGGSIYLHDKARTGDDFEVRGPRNHFPLVEDAAHSVFFAGGIGVTPILSMVRRLSKLGRSWELYYAARSPAAAAFVEELRHLKGGRLTFHFDSEQGGKFLDVPALVTSAGARTHLYCCGPAPMVKGFEAAAAGRDGRFVHREYFAPASAEQAATRAFTVELAASGQSFDIAEGQNILDTLLDAGYDIPFSCNDGMCGTCETRVLAGEIDHRDSVLTPAERASNDRMMICVSRAKGARLVLDL